MVKNADIAEILAHRAIDVIRIENRKRIAFEHPAVEGCHLGCVIYVQKDQFAVLRQRSANTGVGPSHCRLHHLPDALDIAWPAPVFGYKAGHEKGCIAVGIKIRNLGLDFESCIRKYSGASFRNFGNEFGVALGLRQFIHRGNDPLFLSEAQLHEVDPVGQRAVLYPGPADGHDSILDHHTTIGGALLPDETGAFQFICILSRFFLPVKACIFNFLDSRFREPKKR